MKDYHLNYEKKKRKPDNAAQYQIIQYNYSNKKVFPLFFSDKV